LATLIRTDLFRAQAITSLAPRLEGKALSQALSCKVQAVLNLLRISAAIHDLKDRAGTLAGAAHMMEGPERVRALDKALEAAAAITDRHTMDRELGGLAESLNHAQLDRALDAATTPEASSQALTNLAPYLSDDQLDRALAAATAIGWEWECGQALAGLAGYLNQEQQERALEAASRIKNAGIRATAQLRISYHARIPVDRAVVEDALAAATKTEDASSRCVVLAGLASRLQGADQARALRRALDAAVAVTDQNIRGRVLRDLVPYLLPSQLERALSTAAAITDPTGRGLALTSLARRLAEPVRTDAVIRALEAEKEGGKVRVELVALARELGDPLQCRIIQALLDAVADSEDDVDARLALDELARFLDPAQLSRAFDIATALRDDYSREGALACLAPHLDHAQLGRALLAVTAPRFDDFQARAQALASLVPHLQGQSRTTALEEVLEAACAPRDSKARWPFTHDDETIRAGLIITAAPYLDATQLARAQQAAGSFTDNACKVSALTALAAYLESPERTRAVNSALRAVGQIQHARQWGWALAEIAPHLEKKVRVRTLTDALEAAPTVSDETTRAELLLTVAPYLDDAQLAQAVQMAGSFADNGCKASVLAALATYLEEPEKSRAIEKASKAIGTIGDRRYFVWASAHLIPHLHAEARSQVVQRALHASEGIVHQESRARALAAISAHLEGQARTRFLDTALDIAMTIHDEHCQARALASLAADLNIVQLGRALSAATALSYFGQHKPCVHVFRQLSRSETEATRSDIAALIRKFYRAWPPREALLAVISAAADALMCAGGPEAVELLFESILKNDCWR
jgi:hypothetical protein